MKKYAIIGGIIVLAISVGMVVGWMAKDDFNEDQPPEVIDEKDVRKGFQEPEIQLVDRIIWRDARVEREGIDSTAGQAAVDSFVAAVVDTSAGRAPIFLPFDIKYEDDRLAVGATRSDGSYVRRDFRCRQPCVAGARDSTIFAHEQRAIPRLFPSIVKKAAICAAAAGAGYGVGLAADRSPEMLALAGGAGCALIVAF